MGPRSTGLITSILIISIYFIPKSLKSLYSAWLKTNKHIISWHSLSTLKSILILYCMILWALNYQNDHYLGIEGNTIKCCGLTYFYIWKFISHNNITLAFRTCYMKQREMTYRKYSYMWLEKVYKNIICVRKCVRIELWEIIQQLLMFML